MARNVIAIYPEAERAEAAVAELLKEGVPRDRIALVRHDATQRYRQLSTLSDEQRRQKAQAGLGGGALLGAATGALLALGVAFVPGFWIIGAGPLASVVAGGGIGAAVGATAGGLGAALDRLGIPEGPSRRYEDALRRGGTMIAVQAPDDLAGRVVETLERHGPLDLDRSAKPAESLGIGEDDARDPHHIPGALVRSYPFEEPEPV